MTDLADRVERMRRRAPKANQQPAPEPIEATATIYDAAARGIARAIDNAGDQWATAATETVRRYLEANPVLHVDTLRPHLPQLPAGADGRALGAVIAKAKSAGWIEPLNVTVAGWDGPPIVAAVESVASRGGLKTLWRSNIYQGQRP